LSNCKIMEICPLLAQGFPLDEARAGALERSFCRGESKKCARLKAFEELGPGQVPRDIYPGDHRKVMRLIASR
jgi:hypothetical protein